MRLQALSVALLLALLAVSGCAQPRRNPEQATGAASRGSAAPVTIELAAAPPAPLPIAPPADPTPPAVTYEHLRPLGDSVVPFARYLQAVHNRVHVTFADGFLESLNQRPDGDPLQADLMVRLELVLAGGDGSVVRIGIIKTSGVMEFDVGALTSVQDAAPFGAAPEAIRSFDGNVYIHWDLHRDPVRACTTREAAPFLLSK